MKRVPVRGRVFAVVEGLKPLKQDLPTVFNLESKLLQLLRAHFVDQFFFVLHLDAQRVHFLWRYFAIRLRYVIVLVKILD